MGKSLPAPTPDTQRKSIFYLAIIYFLWLQPTGHSPHALPSAGHSKCCLFLIWHYREYEQVFDVIGRGMRTVLWEARLTNSVTHGTTWYFLNFDHD